MTALCDAVAAGALASDPVGLMHRHRHQKVSPEAKDKDASTGMELLGISSFPSVVFAKRKQLQNGFH
jgi:hypothetical protein